MAPSFSFGWITGAMERKSGGAFLEMGDRHGAMTHRFIVLLMVMSASVACRARRLVREVNWR
jgi:hypothetical protein